MNSRSLANPLSCKRCYFSLACSIGSISLACGSLLQIPNTTDRISIQRGLVLTSLGFIYFVSLTDFFNKYLLETQHGILFRKKYRLMISDVMEITNKIVSAIQAYFSFLVGFIVCKSTCTKSFVYASHFLMEAYGWFGTAYFMYDVWSMYKVHTQRIADKLKLIHLTSKPSAFVRKAKNVQVNGGIYDKKAENNFSTNGNSICATLSSLQTVENDIHATYQREERLPPAHHDRKIEDCNEENVHGCRNSRWDFLKYMLTHPLMMIHHIFIGTFGLLVVTYIRGGGHCIYSYMFMMEFSTPFVSLRSILSTMGLKNTRVYVINGLLMLGTFFVCRVLMWPYVMYRYSVAINTLFWQSFATLPRGCIVSILILFLPQLYWFYLMVKGALQVFFPCKENIKASKEQHKLQLHPQSKNNNLSPVGNISIDLKENGILVTANVSSKSVNKNDLSDSASVGNLHEALTVPQ